MRYNKFLWFYIGFIFSTINAAPNQSSINQLNKIFHHQGIFGDKLICYFSRDPICNYLPERPEENKRENNQEQTIIFFLPMTQIAGKETKDMIAKINNNKKDNYSVTFQEVNKPIKGIKITIVFNPKLIMCDYATCDSISMQKGLVFSFHSIAVLEEIKMKTDRVLRYASYEKKTKPFLKVMLDYGHGGNDDGAISKTNIKEKDITASVGSKVADLLRTKGFDVLLTRKSDVFIPLDQRTLLANRNHADLFISIHANSAHNDTTSGIETYWSSRQYLHRIALGNCSCNDTVTVLEKKFDSLSHLLANVVHKNLIEALNEHYRVTDRTVKQKLAQVLIGCDMPAALIELGFLSNPLETKNLTDPQYQQLIAQGICKGVEMYYNTNMHS